MKNFCFALCIVFESLYVNQAFGSETGMPQLNTEFLDSTNILVNINFFYSLYLIIWKIFLPRITYSIENRKSRIVNDLNDEAQKLKENAEKKLSEYNKIIEDTKKEAKKIIEDSKKKLEKILKSKKQKFNDEIEKELMSTRKRNKRFKKIFHIKYNKIAVEVSSEVIRQIIKQKLIRAVCLQL